MPTQMMAVLDKRDVVMIGLRLDFVIGRPGVLPQRISYIVHHAHRVEQGPALEHVRDLAANRRQARLGLLGDLHAVDLHAAAVG